jgi:pSer/pThr/pTyr-binding forkhead associated (FHA) protein
MAFQLSWYHSSDQSAPHRGFRQLAKSDSVTVGREQGSDILLRDKAVSRLHAEIFVDERGVHVKDMNSSNGIQVDGSRVMEAIWKPGQKLSVGPFVIELSEEPGAAPSEIVVPNRNPSLVHSRIEGVHTRMDGQDSGGRIELGEVLQRAQQNHKPSVGKLFSGFLGRTEQIVDCGYLGAIGFIFPEYSFWCVTNSRVCGLLVNRGGWLNFDFGFLKSLNRAVFVQPSLVKLWIWVISWIVTTLLLARLAFELAWWSVFVSSFSDFLSWLFGLVMFLLVLGGGVLLIPWVVRAYYRWFKAGCIFWTEEHAPMVIPSDRHSLRDAQRFISVFTDQKRMLEG